MRTNILAGVIPSNDNVKVASSTNPEDYSDWTDDELALECRAMDSSFVKISRDEMIAMITGKSTDAGTTDEIINEMNDEFKKNNPSTDINASNDELEEVFVILDQPFSKKSNALMKYLEGYKGKVIPNENNGKGTPTQLFEVDDKAGFIQYLRYGESRGWMVQSSKESTAYNKKSAIKILNSKSDQYISDLKDDLTWTHDLSKDYFDGMDKQQMIDAIIDLFDKYDYTDDNLKVVLAKKSESGKSQKSSPDWDTVEQSTDKLQSFLENHTKGLVKSLKRVGTNSLTIELDDGVVFKITTDPTFKAYGDGATEQEEEEYEKGLGHPRGLVSKRFKSKAMQKIQARKQK